MNIPDVEDLICAVLRGENPPWPDTEDAVLADAFLQRSEYHGVQALLNEQLRSVEDWPSNVLRALRQQAVAQAMWELRHQYVLAKVLTRLLEIGVKPVLFKGTALAYSLYPNPVWRRRGDTDFIIPPETRSRVADVLVSLGFVCVTGVSGEFVSYQASYTREEAGGGAHTLDVHWRINNSELLSRLFVYDELHRQALPLPGLCPDALAATPVHALLLACMHRAAHKPNPYYVNGVAHYGGDRLIWLYDVHLLLGSLSANQLDEFVDTAEQKGLRAVCLEGMERARACFHTVLPETVLCSLARPGTAEPLADYLKGSRLRRQWMDFCAIDGMINRLRFVRELFFPPAAFIRAKYPAAQPGWLPWLYVRRAVGGVFKRLVGNRQNP